MGSTREWLGLQLTDLGPPESHMSFGLLTGKPRKNSYGCRILMKEALTVLAAKSPEAAGWFFENIGPARIEGGIFVFQEEECEPLPTLSLPAIDSPIQDI